MISEWCRTLEQIAKANNYRGAKNVFVADAETEVEQKLNIIFPAKLDISKYYTNAREFDLVQYAKDMGFEAEGVRWTPDTSKETAAINISRSLSNGAKIIVEYTRYNGTNDDGTVKTSHGIEVRYAPNEVDQYEVTPCVDISLGVLQDGQNKLPPGEISLIGFTDAGGSVIFVSQKQIERLVSIMQAVKTVNSEETLEGYGRLVQKIYDDFYHYNTYYEDIQNPHYN